MRPAAGERHKSGGVFRRPPAAAACSVARQKRSGATKSRFGLAGSRRQRLNFGVEQMGASEGHHRAAFACFAIEFRATQGYKDVDSYKDVFS